MNLADYLENQVLRQRTHLRPVLDIGAKLYLHIRVSHALGVKDAVCINLAVEMIFILSDLPVKVRSRCQHSPIGSRSRNGTGIHQRNRRNLAVLELAALTVGEVPGGVADTESIVCRGITCTEAWSAESCLHDGACLHDGGGTAVSDQLHVYRHGSRIYA